MGQQITMDSLLIEPSNSLIRQSYASKERIEPLNGDGFGVAWFKPDMSREPALFKSVTPAWNNRNLLNISRVTRSPCILAHVRAATSSQDVSEYNCHPFAWRQFAFCHNGDVGGFRKIKRKLMDSLCDEAYANVLGMTDSEHAFAVFIDEYLKGGEATESERITGAMMRMVHRILTLVDDHGEGAYCYLNMAVTDGTRAAVSHCSTDPDYADTLYLKHADQYSVVKGQTQILSKPGEKPHAVLVASEPLSKDAGWRKVGLNQILVIEEDMTVTTRDIIIRMKEEPMTAQRLL
jgi:predicted glutamine amidotransferase